MKAPPRTDNVLAFEKRPELQQFSPRALFTAVPRGRCFCVKAISDITGESVRLGIFRNRRDALKAAILMAEIAGGRFLP